MPPGCEKMSLDGVYYRMELYDRTVRFRNSAQIHSRFYSYLPRETEETH